MWKDCDEVSKNKVKYELCSAHFDLNNSASLMMMMMMMRPNEETNRDFQLYRQIDSAVASELQFNFASGCLKDDCHSEAVLS